jgi:hypothetical protein
MFEIANGLILIEPGGRVVFRGFHVHTDKLIKFVSSEDTWVSPRTTRVPVGSGRYISVLVRRLFEQVANLEDLLHGGVAVG